MDTALSDTAGKLVGGAAQLIMRVGYNGFSYADLSSPPALTATGGSTSFVEADNVASTPVAIDSGITLSDGDATTAKQGTVSITGNFSSGQDVLGFTNTSAASYGDISASYNASSGVMTLTSASGTATIAQWQNAFRAVTYTDTSVTPSTATRTVSFELTSGVEAKKLEPPSRLS